VVVGWRSPKGEEGGEGAGPWVTTKKGVELGCHWGTITFQAILTEGIVKN